MWLPGYGAFAIRTVIGPAFAHGTVVVYECSGGYNHVEGYIQPIICMENSTWNSTALQCQCKTHLFFDVALLLSWTWKVHCLCFFNLDNWWFRSFFVIRLRFLWIHFEHKIVKGNYSFFYLQSAIWFSYWMTTLNVD